jgi:hypothetical protein
MTRRPIKEAILVGALGLAIMAYALFGLTSCGGVYKVEIPPIQVDVTHHISTTEFLAVFTSQCQRQLGPTATPQQVNDCANAMLAQFFTDLASTIKTGGTP